jgi:hypothetical protein
MQLLRTPSWSFRYATQKELEILRRNLLQSLIKMALKPVRPCATAELCSELKGMELYLLELRKVQSAEPRGRRQRAEEEEEQMHLDASKFPSRTALPG